MRIGIDLGGTKIEGIVLGNDGKVLEKLRLPTPAHSYPATVSVLCDVVNSLQEKAGKILTVGIGTPGAISQPSGLMKNSNSVRLNGKPLKHDIETELGYSIRLENDANCFALSEAHFGAAKHAASVFGVILGTGTGGGIVIGKQLLTGPNSIAGEWGHNSLPDSCRDLIKADRQCHCGRINCIETVLSGRGLSATFQECHGDEKSAVEIAQLSLQDDANAQNSIAIYCQQLARCLATVVNILDPEVIVLGGGLSNIPQLYTDVEDLMRPFVFTDHMQTKLVPPSFGDASGTLGAACLWPDDAAP